MMFSTAHLRPYRKFERVIDFFSPIPSDLTGTATGDAVATLLGAETAGGPALQVVAGAAGGGYSLVGTAINPTTTKAAWVELDSITLAGENASWACGWVGANNAVEVVKTYLTGSVRSIIGGVTTEIDTQSGVQKQGGSNSVMVNGHAGVFVDFTEGDVIGHVASSYVSRVAPTADEDLTFGFRIPSSTDFTVTIKRISLTVWA